VLDALLQEWQAGQAWMAEEFRAANGEEAVQAVQQTLRGVPLAFEPHYELKLRVPGAIGLIRTGDTVQYANIVLESA
jgi:D-ribose pyranase